jgi:hypothetical protein
MPNHVGRFGPQDPAGAATGMSRPRIYLRLRDLTDQGHVMQVSRGRWRAVTDDTP